MLVKSLGLFIFLSGVFIAGVLSLIVIIRWVFRINEIVDYLSRIANKLDPLVKSVPFDIESKFSNCDCCHNPFNIKTLTKMKSGKTVCSSCFKILKSIKVSG